MTELPTFQGHHSGNYLPVGANIGVFTALWLTTPFFWDMTPPLWVIRSRRFKGRQRLHLQASRRQRMNYQPARRNTPEHLIVAYFNSLIILYYNHSGKVKTDKHHYYMGPEIFVLIKGKVFPLQA